MTDFQRAAPVFPVRDLAAAVEHYESLGFDVDTYGGGGYAFARRGAVEVHLAHVAEVDPATSIVSAYFYVEDADALSREWSSASGRHIAPHDTDYGLREGAYVDPDGNLLRFGSPLSEQTSRDGTGPAPPRHRE